MKKLMGAAVIALLLVGCNDEKQSEAGDYLFESVQIEFDNRDASSTEQGREAFQQRLVSVLNEDGKDIYYSITPTEIITYGFGEKESNSIADGRVKLKDVWYTIKPDGADTLRLISDKDSECVIFLCQINVTLKKVAPDSAELRARQAQNAKDIQAGQKKMDDQREEFMRIPMPDLPGILFTPVEGFTLKLPWRFEGRVSHEDIAEGYYQQIDRLTIENVNQAYFAERRKNLGAFFSQSDDEGAEDSTEESSEATAEKVPEPDADKPVNEGSLVWLLRNEDEGFNLFLNVVQGKKEDIDLTRWLATQKAVIFRSQHGAVYYDESDKLHTIYLQYHDATQRYFVGIGDVQSIADAVNAFAILRTVDARYRGNDIVTLDELALPQAQQEARYQTTPGNLVDIAEVHKEIRSSLSLELEKPARFINAEKWVHYADIEFKSRSTTRSREIELLLDTRPIPELIADAQRQNPEGRVAGDLFIYGDSYNLYRDTGNGLTLVFIVPENVGNRVERIMLLSVLRQFDMTTLAVIPAAERKNLHKYSDKPHGHWQQTSRFFVIYEGIIDSQGNLIVPTPEDGTLELEDHHPWLLVRKRSNQGEYEGRITPGASIYDVQGKLQFYTANFGELVDNRLVVGGDGKKQGLYDLDTRRWLAAPAWDEVKGKEGVFIATDYGPAESIYTPNVVRQALLNTQGKMLASGKRIQFVSDTEYLVVTGEKDLVSLIDRQGRVQFSHPGNQIDRIREIDAYKVTLLASGHRERLQGIFSERGETILPMKYGLVYVEGDRLALRSPDLKSISWFSLEEVKNWRKHQPLKEVPAPQ